MEACNEDDSLEETHYYLMPDLDTPVLVVQNEFLQFDITLKRLSMTAIITYIYEQKEIK